jgi:SAM-dependent methyltransferase
LILRPPNCPEECALHNPLGAAMSVKAKLYVLLAAAKSPALLRAVGSVWRPDQAAFRDDARWEREYRADGWAWLWNARESLHHRVIAAFADGFDGAARILDAGCGEGVLQRAMRQVGYASYLGVDLSATAAERAQAAAGDDRTQFRQGDANSFEPEGEFDLIVFNECLYYLSDPRATLLRLSRHLSPRGLIVVSMSMDSIRPGVFMLRIWNDLARSFDAIEEVTMMHGNGGSVRIVKALRPRGAEGVSGDAPSKALVAA